MSLRGGRDDEATTTTTHRLVDSLASSLAYAHETGHAGWHPTRLPPPRPRARSPPPPPPPLPPLLLLLLLSPQHPTSQPSASVSPPWLCPSQSHFTDDAPRTHPDVEHNLALLNQAVHLLEPRFTTRALRALPQLRTKLGSDSNADVLAQLIRTAPFYSQGTRPPPLPQPPTPLTQAPLNRL